MAKLYCWILSSNLYEASVSILFCTMYTKTRTRKFEWLFQFWLLVNLFLRDHGYLWICLEICQDCQDMKQKFQVNLGMHDSCSGGPMKILYWCHYVSINGWKYFLTGLDRVSTNNNVRSRAKVYIDSNYLKLGEIRKKRWFT